MQPPVTCSCGRRWRRPNAAEIVPGGSLDEGELLKKEVFCQACLTRIHLDVRLRTQPRAHPPRPPRGAVRGHRRTREQAPRAARPRAFDGVRRHRPGRAVIRGQGAHGGAAGSQRQSAEAARASERAASASASRDVRDASEEGDGPRSGSETALEAAHGGLRARHFRHFERFPETSSTCNNSPATRYPAQRPIDLTITSDYIVSSNCWNGPPFWEICCAPTKRAAGSVLISAAGTRATPRVRHEGPWE